MKEVVVRPLDPGSDVGRYDVALIAVGYEARSSYVARRVQADTKLAIVFSDRQVHSFASNRDDAVAHGFRLLDDEMYLDAIAQALLAVGESRSSQVVRVLVDISSMTRRWVAEIVWLARTTAAAVDVDFVYAIAEFTAPAEPPLTQYAGPVTPGLAGWDIPEKPLALVLGLGYELDRALGAAELLEPSAMYVFSPIPISRDYERALRDANLELWGIAPATTHSFSYDIRRPFDTFVMLESLAAGLRRTSRVVLIPLGPKIFALCCVLLAAINSAYAVWRISAGPDEIPLDRKPTGEVVGVRAELR